jgi:hypothetical protein
MHLDLRTQAQLYVGLFEKELHPWLTKCLQDVRSVVDVGAAYGEYTLLALLKSSAEHVFSFEPDPEVAAWLQRNLISNGLQSGSRLSLSNTYVGSTEGPGFTAADSLAASLLTPCLLKVDIDGGEGELLRAASGRVLQMDGLRWIIETHSLALERECDAILQSHGYVTRIIPNARWRRFIPEQRPGPDNHWLIAANDGTIA